MWELHQEGGLFIMLPLSILAVAMLLLAARKAIDLFINTEQPAAALKRGLNAIIQIGGFSLALGVLGQAMGLYQMFQAIEAAGNVSPALLAGGLRLSMIVTLYGLCIFLVSALLWFVLRWRYQQTVTVEE